MVSAAGGRRPRTGRTLRAAAAASAGWACGARPSVRAVGGERGNKACLLSEGASAQRRAGTCHSGRSAHAEERVGLAGRAAGCF